MGNCVSQTGQGEFLKGLQSASNGNDSRIAGGIFVTDDLETFQVFVKKRSKFIPGILKVTENEIVFLRSRCETLNWPLQFLRRYGFTSAGIFFFESGRRCSSGEGLHTFQSHQAEAIFQLVQSRIQDNANMGIAIRETHEQSVTESYHSIHNIPSGYTGTRIQPIQRYSSEGTANVRDCSSSSCTGAISYHRPLNRFSYHRQLISQTPKRPRSIAGPAQTVVWPQPPPSYHSAHFCLNQSAFVGNVINEHIIQQLPSESNPSYNHPYVNVLPHHRSATSSPHCLSPVLREYGSASHFTFGSAEQNLNLGVAALRSHQRFSIPAAGISNCSPVYGFFCSNSNPFMNSYDSNASDREATPPQLDYASVAISGNAEEDSSVSVKVTACIARSNDSNFPPRLPSIVNYAKIDLDKTRAVEVAASTVEKENPRRRHFTTAAQMDK
ncbi:unnamed protein product [Thelazia callipaeda]|uniref:IRS-type PTB domain-containing protein n=1 Tax=Thelazia callipaeda TaxID=103827 RepID=A0A158RBX9_THECL|nr:unnamed protein product [Thelazia callipaeda]